ncbi:NUT family member 2G [Plecturocebus cupreus]
MLREGALDVPKDITPEEGHGTLESVVREDNSLEDALSHVPLLRRLLSGHCGSDVLTQVGPTSRPRAQPSPKWCRQEEQPSPHPSCSLPASVYLPSKAGPKAPPACLPPPGPQRPAETKAPEEMPPEVLQEYVNMMEELLGPPAGTTGELTGQWEEGEVEQEGDGMLLDPTYVDNLCSQKDFVTKVEAIIHPRFLEELLSPDPQMDFLALSQELEQEEGLTLARVVEKRRLSLKEERCTRAAPSHGTAWLDSSPSKSAVVHAAERDVPGPQQGVSMEACPPQTAARDPQGRRRAHTGMSRSINLVVLLERLDSRRLGAARPYSSPQDHTCTPKMASQDPRGVVCTRGPKTLGCSWRLDSPGQGLLRQTISKDRDPARRGTKDRDSGLGMVFVMGTSYRLRPWKLSQSPVPASGLLSPEGRGPQGALLSQPGKRRALSPAPTPATKSKK